MDPLPQKVRDRNKAHLRLVASLINFFVLTEACFVFFSVGLMSFVGPEDGSFIDLAMAIASAF